MVSRTRTVLVFLRHRIALVVGGVAVEKERLAEAKQCFHPFVASGEEAFARFVALDDGAGPAAEAGIAATRGGGIDNERAFAAGGVGVKFVEGAVVVAPRVRLLQKVSPDFLRAEEFDRIGNPDVGQILVAAKAVLRLVAQPCSWREWSSRSGARRGGG